MLEWVFASAPSGIALIEYDHHVGGTVVMANPALEKLTGYGAKELIGMPAFKLIPDADEETIVGRNELIAGKRSYWAGEVSVRRQDGQMRTMNLTISSLTRLEGSLVGIAHVSDVTDSQAQSDRIDFLADHDPLTGLPEAQHMERLLSEVVLAADGSDSPRALVFIDIDGLAFLNDRLGYDGGDQVILGVAALARAATGDTGTTVRIGANRFALLWPDMDAGETLNAASTLLHEVRRSVLVPTAEGSRTGGGVTVSAGVAVFGFGGEPVSPTRAMATADLALRKAKLGGRDCLVTMEVEDDPEGGSASADIRERVRLAVDADDLFSFEAQSIVDAPTGETIGHELLLRLDGGDGQTIMPAAFIPVAEATGLIRRLDRWVVRRAAAIAASGGIGGQGTKVWINISAQSLADERLAELVEDLLELYEIPADRLVLEVTEREGSLDFRDVGRMITRLREIGCSCAIDDFGSGYGGFDHLKEMAFDIIKIDGDFIEGLAHSPVDRAITSGIIAAAKAAGRSVVAEYVVDQQTLEILIEMGVDCVQGQLIGMPQPIYASGP